MRVRAFDDNAASPSLGVDALSAAASSVPSRVATGLGYLAIVPFLVGAALPWLADPQWRPPLAQALSSYAAVVISFIGAIHWGLAFPQSRPAPRLFVWGVVPSLVAWAAVSMPPHDGLVVHALMLVACYLVDRATYPVQNVGAWLPLRLRLTIVATACCIVGAIAR
jgi:Protein of unknown function (DUF3429)